MNIDKTLKIVWLVCGISLLIGMLSIAFFALGLNRIFRKQAYEPVGVAIDNPSQQGLVKTTLSLNTGGPIKLGNTEHYAMPVFISYFEISEKLHGGFGSDSYRDKDLHVNDPSNIIFFDQQLNVTTILLNKKALIKNWHYPVPEEDNHLASIHQPMKFILYDIAFVDTNQDGQLDEYDQSDLFISNLDGSGFTQITEGLQITDYDFLNDYSVILIQAASDTPKKNLVFYKYTLNDRQLTGLESIGNSIQQIETMLSK